MFDRQEYLDICERCLSKYLTLSPENFNVDHSNLMLKCLSICKAHLYNDNNGDIICFTCASICLDYLDPTLSVSDEEILDKFEKIRHYSNIESGYGGAI
ncbi:MAG TPA: hypothetical protein VNJ08_07855 [Bacteriovoracaceae bacterium]|nr:hypothetical protein [Bacteriovoracaceae bacterium]